MKCKKDTIIIHTLAVGHPGHALGTACMNPSCHVLHVALTDSNQQQRLQMAVEGQGLAVVVSYSHSGQPVS